MARPRRVFAPGLLYHVIARGNHRQATFPGDHDARAYLARLARYRSRYGVVLYAYCLMPNHVHLLLRTGDAPLAKFMQGLQQSYTLWFNRAYGTVGHLFQGRYQAIVCDSDRYLAALVRYIELNPVRAGLVRDPVDYRYSSHREYLAGPSKDRVVEPDRLLPMLGGRDAYRRFIAEGVAIDPESARPLPGREVMGGASPALPPGHWADRLRPSAAAPTPPRRRADLTTALQEVARRVALPVDALRGAERGSTVADRRAVVAYVLVRRRGFRATDVAAELTRDPATILAIVARVERQLGREPAMTMAVARALGDPIDPDPDSAGTARSTGRRGA